MVGCTAEIPSKHDRSGSKGEMTALKSDFRYTPEADMDDPMSKNGRRSKWCSDRGYGVFFEVRADLAWVARSMSGGGCCSPAIAHQTPT